ncbi:MAG TPA: YceH family protein [Kiritimatiellia bacterium]|nr:YceH family protein [Kiritimatiellia bacterium]HMP34888.1 YceH family protein [Kiritimatiellia bacterium]
MDIMLTPEETRILGALLEKEVTTPDYYPMTLNALVNACNQKSCRDPVTAYDESTVSFHLDLLRESKRLAALVSGADNRVPKFRQRLTEQFFFTPAERAVLCELMLRGPQTVGELRNRAERIHSFTGSDEVLAALKELESRQDGPWVVLLPRQPGHKEARYQHLLGGAPAAGPADSVLDERTSGGSMHDRVGPADRLARLEAETTALRTELDAVKEELRQFRAQFG